MMFYRREKKWALSLCLLVMTMVSMMSGSSSAFMSPSSSRRLSVSHPRHGVVAGGRIEKQSVTELSMMIPMDDWSSGISSSMAMLSASSLQQPPLLTEDDIATAFKVATLGPQFFWLFIILLPNADITKRIMGGYGPIFLCSCVHLFIVVASLFQDGSTAPMAEFANVFDSALPAKENLAAMSRMFTFDNFVSEEWSHVLTWDLFVGRWIWLDGLKRNIFTAHSVLLCNLIGPPGFLLHLITCAITGKPFPSNEALSPLTTDDESLN